MYNNGVDGTPQTAIDSSGNPIKTGDIIEANSLSLNKNKQATIEYINATGEIMVLENYKTKILKPREVTLVTSVPTSQPIQETSTPVEVPSVEREKQPIPNRPDALYLSGMNGNTFNITESAPHGTSYYRIYDINGDYAKYEYFGDDSFALATRGLNTNNAEILGSYRTATFINTKEAGTVRRDSEGN